jgi:hypothetical protein
VVTPIKSDTGPDGGGFHYEIKETLEIPGIVTSRIEWQGVAEASRAISLVRLNSAAAPSFTSIMAGAPSPESRCSSR